MNGGEAPERAREVLVLVGSGSLGRVDLVDSPGAPQLMNRHEDSSDNWYVVDGL